jgi:hypothetical protein
MAVSFSERIQIVYSDNSNKYNIEKEAKDEQLSSIEFVYSLICLGTAVALFNIQHMSPQ